MAWQPVYQCDFKSSRSKVLIKGGLGQLGTGLARFFFILSWFDLDMFTKNVVVNRSNKATVLSDMEFVQNFTPPDFQAKNFTPSISPNFNSFSKKKHKK